MHFPSIRVAATAATVAVLGATMLAACSTASSSDPDTLVVYSNSVSDGRGDWLKEQASAAGFALEFVDLGGGDIQNRLVAEQANPIADVVFGLNDVYFQNLKNSDVLEPYQPAWADQVPGDMGDGEDYWPIVHEPIMLVYNDAAYTTADAPTDWEDLWEQDRFHGRYETPSSIGGATSQLVISGILARYLDESGELGVSDEGWAAIEAFFANGSTAVPNTDLYARLASGEVDMGQMWLAGKASREEEYGISTTAVNPEIGVPMATQSVALVKGSGNAEKAQEFIDWFGSGEVQAKWSQEFFTAPTNEQALADANQDAVEQTNAFTPQDIDWETVAEHLPEWIERIELQYL